VHRKQIVGLKREIICMKTETWGLIWKLQMTKSLSWRKTTRNTKKDLHQLVHTESRW
jgi:hypothetical protein